MWHYTSNACFEVYLSEMQRIHILCHHSPAAILNATVLVDKLLLCGVGSEM